MPRVRYINGGDYYIRDGPSFTDADPEADVSAALADRLTDQHNFVLIEVDDDADAEGGSDADADASTDDTDTTAADTCTTVKTDGEVCGRPLPCRYHSDDDTDEA